jgi:hypothetical protein
VHVGGDEEEVDPRLVGGRDHLRFGDRAEAELAHLQAGAELHAIGQPGQLVPDRQHRPEDARLAQDQGSNRPSTAVFHASILVRHDVGARHREGEGREIERIS